MDWPYESPRPDSFHHFSRLPTELRLKIWDYNLPGPRVVPIRCGSTSPSLSHHHHRRPSGCTSPAPIPVNLHVCREARAEALQAYAPAFGIARQPGRIYFDFGRDVLYFGPRDGYMASEAQFRTALTLIEPAELAAVRRLAVSEALFWADARAATTDRGGPYQSAMAASLTADVLDQLRARLPGLRELVFVPRAGAAPAGPQHHHHHQQARMARQVEAAVESVRGRFPDWTPPPWRVAALGEVADPPRPASGTGQATGGGGGGGGGGEDGPAQPRGPQEAIRMRSPEAAEDGVLH